MHRIDSPGTAVALPTPEAVGATVGYFTEGDPGSGTPATDVSADWLNAVQEELISVMTAAGVSPDKAARDQLKTAIQKLIQDGALWANLSIVNNQVAAANLTGLVFNKASVYAARIFYHLYRKTDTGGSEVVESGEIRVRYKPGSDAWDLTVHGDGDDAGVTFSVTSAGQLQYTSTNIAGSNYVGELRVSDVKTIRKT